MNRDLLWLWLWHWNQTCENFSIYDFAMIMTLCEPGLSPMWTLRQGWMQPILYHLRCQKPLHYILWSLIPKTKGTLSECARDYTILFHRTTGGIYSLYRDMPLARVGFLLRQTRGIEWSINAKLGKILSKLGVEKLRLSFLQCSEFRLFEAQICYFIYR